MLIFFASALLAAARPAAAGEISALATDAAGKPLADAVVYLRKAPARETPAETAVMDQVNKELAPHVLPVLVGTQVLFPNKDDIHHHLYSFSKAKEFELPLYKSAPPAPIVMDKPGVVKLGCNIHDWMRGYIVVLENPYFAKTDASGRAELRGVPDGRYEIELWSERLQGSPEKTRQKVMVGASPARVKFAPALAPAKKMEKPAETSY